MIEADRDDLRRIRQVFRDVGRTFPVKLQNTGFRAVVRVLKEQTRRRIKTEKTSPDGERWPDWSEDYAATRGPQHSLLVAERDLLKTLQVQPVAGGLDFGTPLDYPEVHQEGKGRMPQREWLGVSDVDPLQSALDQWANQEWSNRGLG